MPVTPSLKAAATSRIVLAFVLLVAASVSAVPAQDKVAKRAIKSLRDGRFDDAAVEARQAIDICQGVNPPDSSCIALALRVATQALASTNRYAEAEEAYLRLIGNRKYLNDSDYHELADCFIVAAEDLYSEKQIVKSLIFARRGLDLLIACNSTRKMEAIEATKQNLTWMYSDAEDSSQHVRLFLERQRHIGDDTDSIDYWMLSSIAWGMFERITSESGQNEAVVYGLQAVECLDRPSKPDLTVINNEPITLYRMRFVGRSLLQLAYYDDAERLSERAIEIAPLVPILYGIVPPDLLLDLGTIKFVKGNHIAAIKYISDALVAAEADSTDECELPSLCLRMLAEAHLGAGDVSAAESTIRRALAVRLTNCEVTHRETAALYFTLGKIHAQQAVLDSAVYNFTRAYDITVRVQGASHADAAACLVEVGLAYLALQKFDSCYAAWSESLRIYKNTLGDEHPTYAVATMYMGDYYATISQFDKAKHYYQSAYAVFSAREGRPDPLIHSVLERLVWLNRALGSETEAVFYEKRSAEVTRQLGP